MNKDIVFKFCTFVLLLFFGTFSFANSLQDAEDIIYKLNAAAEISLVPLEKIISSNESINKKPIGNIVVAYFDNDSDDNLNWGLALSEMLRINLKYSSNDYINMPPLDWSKLESDSWGDGMEKNEVMTSLRSLTILSQHLGIDRAITGKVIKLEQTLTLSLSLISIPNGKVIKKKKFKGNIEESKVLLLDAHTWVYENIVGEIKQETREYFKKVLPDEYEHIRQYVEIITLAKQKEFTKSEILAKKLYTRSSDFLAGDVAYMESFKASDNMFLNNETMSLVASKHPEHGYLQFLASVRYQDQRQLAMINERIKRLKAVTAEYPYDYYLILTLVDTLAETGHEVEAVSLVTEALTVWPNNYRVWWSASYATMKLAWYFRGGSYYDNVSQKGRRQYQVLMEISNEMIDYAIKLHPDNAGLYVMKMQAIGRSSDELITAFHTGVKLDPHKVDLYSVGMNYTAPKWGGSINNQLGIYKLAKENNISKDWLDWLYSEYILTNENSSPLSWVQIKLFNMDCDEKCQSNLVYIALFLILVFYVLIINKPAKTREI